MVNLRPRPMANLMLAMRAVLLVYASCDPHPDDPPLRPVLRKGRLLDGRAVLVISRGCP